MGKMKNLLMDMQEYAWHLMLDADLVEPGVVHDFAHAKELFLAKYPGNERIWDSALIEYHNTNEAVY